MNSKYKQFLLIGADRFIISKHYHAIKHTVLYYKQRSDLKSLHKLRISNVPFLIYSQHKHDSFKKQQLIKSVVSVYKHEQSEQLQEFLAKEKSMSSCTALYFQAEREELKKVGFLAYVFAKGAKGQRYIKSNFTADYVSKWVVGYANLYHKALEELVEGHREVTRNHDIVLDDGKTVADKLKTFQDKISGVKIDYEKIKDFKK